MYFPPVSCLSCLFVYFVLGLCHKDILLPKLWHLITNLGPQSGLKVFLDHLISTPNDTSPPMFHLLRLICDAAAHIITILDDVELYEHQTPFTLDNLVDISLFLNYFVFRTIWNQFIGKAV